MAVMYISWAPHCSRSDYTARELNGVSHMVYWRALGSNFATIWLKYLGQALQTWQLLLQHSPEAVFVMTPPVVAGLVALPYCAFRGIPLVLDAHTGAFVDPRWRYFQRLQLWLCRRATTTIVTNTQLEQLLVSHGADATIFPDVPVKYPRRDGAIAKAGFLVAAICSFDYDEPIDPIVETARAMPDIQFLVTGEAEKLVAGSRTLPSNISSTGFLDSAAYGELLRTADVVMALTTGKNKMLRAAYEAIYQGTPLIISDSPLLRQEFNRATILVDNSVASIVHAVRTIQASPEAYRREAVELRRLKEERWARNRQTLIDKLNRASPVPVL